MDGGEGYRYGGEQYLILHFFCVKIRKESWRYEEKCVFLRLNIIKRLKIDDYGNRYKGDTNP